MARSTNGEKGKNKQTNKQKLTRLLHKLARLVQVVRLLLQGWGLHQDGGLGDPLVLDLVCTDNASDDKEAADEGDQDRPHEGEHSTRVGQPNDPDGASNKDLAAGASSADKAIHKGDHMERGRHVHPGGLPVRRAPQDQHDGHEGHDGEGHKGAELSSHGETRKEEKKKSTKSNNSWTFRK